LTSSAKPVRKSPVPSDIEIAQAATMKPIQAIAEKAGILEDELELYGRYKAKIDYMALLERLKDKPDGKIVNVTAITPTPLGEGKTVTAVGLSESMNAIGTLTPCSLSVSRLWARSSASRAARPAAAIRSSSPWRTSTCTSPATSMPSAPPTTCWPP